MTQKKKPFLGHSVKDGRLRFTSVSAIKLFDVRKEGCKRKWAYKYRFGIKTKKIGAQIKGIDYAAALEHYLTSASDQFPEGEDVLPPVLQQAKRYFPKPGPDLECEQPLGDMEKALAARDAAFLAPPGTRELLFGEAKRFAGLHANGVPIDGAADIRHTRGEYIDKSGIICKEPADIRVVNIDDLKAVSQIFPHKITRGEKAGQIRMPFTLTDAEIGEDVQMLGYARHSVDKYDWMTHARLGLIYTNTKKKEADLRMALISKQQILDRWHGNIEPIVVEMEKNAGAEKPEDVEPNVKACDAYTHVDPNDPEGKRVLQGCPHRYYCPLSTLQVSATLLGNHKESAMSLFDAFENPAASTVVTITTSSVPTDPAAYAAQVEAEKLKLLGLSAPPPPPPPVVAPPPPPAAVSYGFCVSCGVPLTSENASKLPNGATKHMGCAAAQPAAPPPPSSPIAVNPPDQPRAANMLQAAAAVPADAIPEIQNPQLKAEVEAHARAHAEKARIEAEEAAQQKAALSVWCNTSATKILITAEIAVEGKWVCKCGKSYTVKALKPVRNAEGNMETVIPRHKPPKKDGEEVAVAPPPPPKQIVVNFVTDDEEETGDDAEVVVPPPAPPPVEEAPPLLPVTVAAQPLSSSAPSVDTMQTNGHTNGHANGASVITPRGHANLLPGVSIFAVQTADGAFYNVIASSVSDALQKIMQADERSEVVAVEMLPGAVLR